jgi:N-glycosylase/DNA lyase
VVSGGALKLRQEGDTLHCESGSDRLDGVFVRNYLRLDDDLGSILESITVDETMTRAVQEFYGMRLVRQERWECLASFLLATNANIPRIRKMISKVSAEFGEAFDFEGTQFHAFPNPSAIAGATSGDLEDCGLGYRAGFLRHVARSIRENKFDMRELTFLDYESARKALLTELFGEKLLLGVGPKVADCFLLYSCDKDEAFPIDVWIARALAKWYPALLLPRQKKMLSQEKPKLGRADYEFLSRAARKHFGQSAGYAQQYLYMAARTGGLGKASATI